MSPWHGPVTLWKGSVRLSSWATIMRKPPIQHWSYMKLERTEQTWLEHHQNKSPAVHQRQLGICLLYSSGFPDHVFFSLTYPGLKGRRVKHKFKTKVTSIDKLSNNLLSQPNLRYVLSRCLKNEVKKYEKLKPSKKSIETGLEETPNFQTHPCANIVMAGFHTNGEHPQTCQIGLLTYPSTIHLIWTNLIDSCLLCLVCLLSICAVFARFWISFLAVSIPDLNWDHLGRIAVLNPTIFGSGYFQSHNFLKLRNCSSK